MPGRGAGVDHARDRVVPRVLLGGRARLVGVVRVGVLDHAVAGMAAADAGRLHAPRGGEVGRAEAHALHAGAGGGDLLEVDDALRGLEDRVHEQGLLQAGLRLQLGQQAVHVVDVPRSLDLGDHDHVELVADLGDELREVVQHPRAVEAVHARPELGVAEVDLLADPDQALAGGLLAVGRDRVLEVAEQDVGLLGHVRHLRRHLLVRGVEEMDHPRGLERDLAWRIGRADARGLKKSRGFRMGARRISFRTGNRLGSQRMAVATRASGEDRRAARDHRDGAPVRRRADHPQGRALRPRGRVPRADRRADEGARPVRGHDPRGVRRDGARPHHLRDDRRGAVARLDLDLRRRQHPFHRLLPADEVRHRRAEGALPAEDGDGRDPGRVLAVGARGRLRRPGHQGDRDQGRRRLGPERPEDVGHERPALGHRVRPDEERHQGRPALQGHDLLHHREGAGRGGEHGQVRRPGDPAQDQEDGLQGRRVDRAGLRRLPLPAPTASSAARRRAWARASAR